MSNEAWDRMAAGPRRVLQDFLQRAGLELDEVSGQLLAGDGSERRFLRLTAPGWQRIVVLPAPPPQPGLAEAAAFWRIGRHLRKCGVPVPELYDYDRHTGLVLCEDLGDGLLQERLQSSETDLDAVRQLYRQALDLLLGMQLRAAVGFDPAWGWDTGHYDRELMLARESGYFWQACCHDLLGLRKPVGLDLEFQRLAELAALEPAGFFLHRDFQSRNLLVQGDRLRLLDFQGGRLGPLGYDLAALLNDPYADLAEPLKEELFDYYRQNLAEVRPDLAASFAEGYLWLAWQRNLQILGAFAYLSRVQGKTFFRRFLRPAAENLDRLLREPAGQTFPLLRTLARQLPERLDLIEQP